MPTVDYARHRRAVSTKRSVFFVLDIAAAVYAILAVATTALVFAAASAALEPLGMPALTSPFVLVVWFFLLASTLFPRLRALEGA